MGNLSSQRHKALAYTLMKRPADTIYHRSEVAAIMTRLFDSSFPNGISDYFISRAMGALTAKGIVDRIDHGRWRLAVSNFVRNAPSTPAPRIESDDPPPGVRLDEIGAAVIARLEGLLKENAMLRDKIAELLEENRKLRDMRATHITHDRLQRLGLNGLAKKTEGEDGNG